MPRSTPTRCEQCGQLVVLVDDTAYNGPSLCAVMIVHGCSAPHDELPQATGEAVTLTDADCTPAAGLISQVVSTA